MFIRSLEKQEKIDKGIMWFDYDKIKFLVDHRILLDRQMTP